MPCLGLALVVLAVVVAVSAALAPVIPGSPSVSDNVVVSVADVARSVDHLAAVAPLDPSCSQVAPVLSGSACLSAVLRLPPIL